MVLVGGDLPPTPALPIGDDIMSDLIQPMLVMETSIGAVAVALQIDTTREEAETEAAYILHTAPDDVVVFRATVLMLNAETASDAVDAWAAGLPVHSVDCDCEETQELRESATDKWGEEWYPDDFV